MVQRLWMVFNDWLQSVAHENRSLPRNLARHNRAIGYWLELVIPNRNPLLTSRAKTALPTEDERRVDCVLHRDCRMVDISNTCTGSWDIRSMTACSLSRHHRFVTTSKLTLRAEQYTANGNLRMSALT